MNKARSSLAIIMMCSMGLFLTRCNNVKTNEAAAREDSIDKKMAIVTPSPGFAASPGLNTALPNLWESATKFESGGPLAFRFFIDSANDLTVYGWSQPYNRSEPTIKMQTSTLSGVELTDGLFLGNILLKGEVLKNLRARLATDSFKAVIFHPFIDTSKFSNRQLIYQIWLSTAYPLLRSTVDKSITDSSAATFKLAGGSVTPTDYYLNPSPPRNEQ